MREREKGKGRERKEGVVNMLKQDVVLLSLYDQSYLATVHLLMDVGRTRGAGQRTPNFVRVQHFGACCCCGYSRIGWSQE